MLVGCPPPCLPQEDFLECKRQRLEGLLAAAGLMLKTLAVDRGLLSPAGGWAPCAGGHGRACCIGGGTSSLAIELWRLPPAAVDDKWLVW